MCSFSLLPFICGCQVCGFFPPFVPLSLKLVTHSPFPFFLFFFRIFLDLILRIASDTLLCHINFAQHTQSASLSVCSLIYYKRGNRVKELHHRILPKPNETKTKKENSKGFPPVLQSTLKDF